MQVEFSDDEASSTSEIEEEEHCIDFDEIAEDEARVYSFTTMMEEPYLRNMRRVNFVEEEEDPSFLQFILVDIDVTTDKQYGTMVALFGRASPSNKSVAVHLNGWYAYLCIEEPDGWNSEVHDELLKNALRSILTERVQERTPYISRIIGGLQCDIIMGIETMKGTDIMGYNPRMVQKSFLKIKVATPLLCTPLRDVLEEGLSIVIHGNEIEMREGTKTKTFNSNLEPVLQFMVDQHMSGCQWCQVPVERDDFVPKKSTCDIEIEKCSVDQLRLLELSERSDVGSIRILSFDLEAAGRKGVFPDPAIDPVIQIGIHFEIAGETDKTKIKPILLSFKTCDDIQDAEVMSFITEEAMLIAFRDIMVHFDPDFITGYNICNFDMDYLKKRAETLNIGSNFSVMTRMNQQSLRVREVTFQSAQVGKRKSNKVTVKGRAVLDVYKWMKDNFSLEEYSLNAVSLKFLGDAKEDIHFTEITPKWNLGPETRKELGVYCLKDALLPLHLMDKLNITLNAIERSRVTGLPCEWVLNRGMLVRFTSQLMRESMDKGYLLPHIDKDSPLRQETTKYMGATVLDVERGLWNNVAVLDFSSMYPCQIIAENLCYSTYLGQHNWPTYSLREKPLYFQGHKFVSERDRQGVIPCILRRMLDQRKIAKAAYAAETEDPVKKLVLKARELSYKVVCNGIYGALGCRNALIPLRAIAETTTGLGRKDILRVKEIAEGMFTVSNGYAGNAKVVCGDTDSVFVCMPMPLGMQGMDSIAESMKYANILAEYVNSEMKKPKKIEPEKVFSTILLMKKKRYAGLKYETLTDEPKIDIKGIECVRRDGCPLIRNLVRETVERLARTADVDGAALLVREVVNKIMTDQVSNEEYAIKKMLRKSIQDCAHPMTQLELDTIRRGIRSDKTSESQLTEAEQDEAIRLGVKIPWRIFRKMPHTMVAWKMRLKDPGNAPVLGEAVRYVITHNGGKMVSEKAESISKPGVIIDRNFYLTSLRKAIDGIFTPIVEQRRGITAPSSTQTFMSKEHMKKSTKMTKDAFEKIVKKDVEEMIWKQLMEAKLTTSVEKKRALVENSPIMQAFMRGGSTKKANGDNMK